jgi:hypothetical protein
MELGNVKKKLSADRKTKPFVKRTVIINPGGNTQIITKRVSLQDIIEDKSETFVDNPEDMGFRREMEGW